VVNLAQRISRRYTFIYIVLVTTPVALGRKHENCRSNVWLDMPAKTITITFPFNYPGESRDLFPSEPLNGCFECWRNGGIVGDNNSFQGTPPVGSPMLDWKRSRVRFGWHDLGDGSRQSVAFSL